PACVVVCPTEAILVGDLDDPTSRVARMVGREPLAVRRPEKDTRPKLFYRGAHQATLDPLAARRPAGDLFLWSEQKTGGDHVVSGHPAAGSSAAAVLAYDVPHRAPWDWRVSLYTLTKGVSAGAYLLTAALVAVGVLDPAGALWRWVAPVVGLVFLALTGALLVWDLEHPERFYLIFTRPQWKSWLVRGGFLLGGYGVVLAAHLVITATGAEAWLGRLSLVGALLAIATAVYTAYLFAQARARDLWQSPLLPPHLLVQALMAGAAVLLPAAAWVEVAAAPALATVLAATAVMHLFLVAGEVTLGHPTAHARRAIEEMTRGRFAAWFWSGMALAALAVAAPWLGVPALSAAVALGGLLAFEHAYVQAGQSVPLA
ncbi:MAG: polysulfide reductase NrfD, partial [Acidobacteria bacterium]|nr:polysulfide reductase NrfD [Acidobacteriota bacterium]